MIHRAFHALGLEHERLSYKYQGLDQRLTDIAPFFEAGRVVDEYYKKIYK